MHAAAAPVFVGVPVSGGVAKRTDCRCGIWGRRRDRVPGSRTQRRQRRLDQPAGGQPAAAAPRNARRREPPPMRAIPNTASTGMWCCASAKSSTQLGVRTAMSRGNDNALGPCVDQRAAMANALRPDAIVSIHAGRRPSGWPRVSRQLFEPAAQRRPIRRRRCGWPQVMASQLAAAGLTPSTYRGTNGLYGRARSRGSESCAIPVDSDRAGQHERTSKRRPR